MWQCAQTGDCCRTAGMVTMRQSEAALVRAATDRPMTWVAHPADRDLVGLVNPDGSAVCPCLDGGRCSVYDVRPHPCRVFACLRATGEVLRPGGPMGCENAADRLRYPKMRAFLVRYQAQHDAWGRTHGWVQ